MTKFPGLDGQIRLVVDWILDVFLPRDITQLQIFHEEDVHREHFEPGETIFDMGDVGQKVYFIVRGEATVVLDGKGVATLRAGEMFGEAALVTNHPRLASVQAQTALDAVAVNRAAFTELVGHLPGFNQTVEALMSERMGRLIDLRGEVAGAMEKKGGK